MMIEKLAKNKIQKTPAIMQGFVNELN